MRASIAALAVLSLILLIETLQLESVARRIPLIVIVPLTVLCLIQLFARAPSTNSEQISPDRPSTMAALFWVATLPLALLMLGTTLGPALFVLLFMRAHGRELWSAAVVGAGLAGLLVFLLFNVLLDTTAPVGLLLRPFLG